MELRLVTAPMKGRVCDGRNSRHTVDPPAAPPLRCDLSGLDSSSTLSRPTIVAVRGGEGRKEEREGGRSEGGGGGKEGRE
jgi:hypothetical protein